MTVKLYWQARIWSLASSDPRSQETNVLGFQGFPEAFYCQPYVESLLLLVKDSRASSYGGAKKMEAKETIKKKKRHQKTGSTCSEQQDEVDTSFIFWRSLVAMEEQVPSQHKRHWILG